MARRKKADPTEIMVVNDAADECRIAILQDGHLEELYAENAATATSVNNIYKGRVTNVEPAIQAAFVDFGQGTSGFLHISDLHPRYFPGDKEQVERVGKKIPRRDRPPIQEALKRGDEVLVQVLKEGIGTKGPTLTSYLSIPGRLLVLMPEMDRVGVSRKVEDDESRREMRKVLDTLELPDGFGFILRTAGVGQTKTELKRDVAYLTRLWKVMEKRIKTTGAPCELYTESDLLVRTIRDVLRPSISAVIVDSDSGFERVSQFLRVVAPRTAAKIVRYHDAAPIFHAFDIERQIDLIHSREVPLPSGGRLVIDQTEALVAIDVNSGRSRSARDSETNAYKTNCEAVDEICRQLRLRDLGGLVIHDLIDMYQARHRKAIEERFKDRLKSDRAKTTITRISQFGILEMTRQRMRPSIRSAHFIGCPACHGLGEIQSPDSIASTIVREARYYLQFDRVKRLEVNCSTRVATVLLSQKRRELVHLEDRTGTRVDVIVKDAFAVDRIEFYAYDDRNADIDLTKLPTIKAPSLSQLEAAEKKHQKDQAEQTVADDAAPSSKRRRRRRRKSGPADATAIALAGGFEPEPEEDEVEETPTKSGRKRRRRRGRKSDADAPTETVAAEASEAESEGEEKKTGRRRRRRGARAREVAAETKASAAKATEVVENIRVYKLARELGIESKAVLAWCEENASVELKNHMSSVDGELAARIRVSFGAEEPSAAEPSESDEAAESSDGAPKKKSRRRRRSRRRGGDGGGEAKAEATEAPDDAASSKPRKKSRRRGRKSTVEAETPTPETSSDESTDKPSRRRRRKKKTSTATASTTTKKSSTKASKSKADAVVEIEAPKPAAKNGTTKKRRSLYASRRPVSASRDVSGDSE